ncbi:SDR family oxidoreductase [Dactylosporangium fulvum]|uniref:SDR family NAD(P)-dependent oxidoreductase n=1 Tax=Dactylosporangium fulvum TaxID=53359 RepID=UPI0031D3EF6D
MFEDLSGKVGIVAGGAGAIGASQVRLLVRLGAKVVVADLNDAAGQSLVAELGSGCVFVHADASSEQDWTDVVSTAVSRFGRVDMLSNSFGIAPQSTFADLSYEEYMRLIAVNQTAVFLGIKAVLTPMKQQRSGSIVNVSSGAAYRAQPYLFAYSASKAAVVAMSRDAGVELGAYGIRVNAICPGGTRSELNTATTTAWARTRPSYDREHAFDRHPLGRIGEPEEVANMAVFLLSDAASYCTGNSYLVDGGLLAGIRP